MIIVFGSINLDLIFTVPRIPAPGETVLGPYVRIEPGGKGANQAVAAARDGASVIMAGAVGRDTFAASALTLLRAAGVDLNRVLEADTSTGCAAIGVDPVGDNAIMVGSGANLTVRHGQIEDTLLGPQTTVVLFSW
jgi:ribokinase